MESDKRSIILSILPLFELLSGTALETWHVHVKDEFQVLILLFCLDYLQA